MWVAFHTQTGRLGNPAREALLQDSRDQPWSEAERRGHRLLRAAGITGWQTIQPVAGFWVDVLFARERLVLEIDGWAVHGARQAFEDDRFRRNLLVLAGYRVLNFTWRQLEDAPAWVLGCIRTALCR
jgi:very-short-patch-repair endonuclease